MLFCVFTFISVIIYNILLTFFSFENFIHLCYALLLLSFTALFNFSPSWLPLFSNLYIHIFVLLFCFVIHQVCFEFNQGHLNQNGFGAVHWNLVVSFMVRHLMDSLMFVTDSWTTWGQTQWSPLLIVSSYW